MIRRLRMRWVAVLVIAMAVIGVAAIATATAVTQAAWNDKAHTSAPVTAGTWNTSAGTCTAMNRMGKAVSNGSCKVTAVTFSQWSDGKNTIRDYYIDFELSSNATYPNFTVDLSKGTGSGTWSWTTAGTIATSQYSLVSGYKCSELPTLRANGPSNWGTSYEIWVRVIMEKTGAGANRNCA